MKTDSIEVGRVLQDSRRFTVPIYQRQYAWKADRLQPFWEDLVAKGEELLDGTPRFQHYLGALILAPGVDGYSVGRVSSVQVVDGQQRLTTFQLFLAALREVAGEMDQPDIVKALDVYVYNDARSAGGDGDLASRLKLMPTPADRAVFRDLMTESLAEVKARYPDFFYMNGAVKVGASPRALLAFLYFKDRIAEYARVGLPSPDETTDDEDFSIEDLIAEMHGEAADGRAGERLQALADALLLQFKLVIITLEEGDDAQVIFETLNSRGEPLLAMDLVRNNIFHRAEAQNLDAEQLFEEKWKPFDATFWKEDSPRAKPKRPRIDHFLSHALTAQTGQETSMREIYAEYRAFARPKGKPRFETVGEELDALLQFKPIFEALERCEGDADLVWLGQKLSTWEVSTVYPLVFAIAAGTTPPEEKAAIYRLIYSYIVRRAICGLTTKSLNKTFARITTACQEFGATMETFIRSFDDQTGPAVRFPSDAELREAVIQMPIYEMILKRERLMDILWEIEKKLRTKFQADGDRPSYLSIEHVLPQTWMTFWPLADGRQVPADRVTGADPEMIAATRTRDTHLHRLGNLTLTTVPLNSSMQNAHFNDKRDRLGQSLLALNSEFPLMEMWDEGAIVRRGTVLANLAAEIWPGV